MNTTLYVIVLYKCNLLESESFTTITQSLKFNNSSAKLLIWDNSPESQNYAIQKAKPTVWNEIQYFHSPNNSGLSMAYNYAAKIAQQNGYEWIGLLDQDTFFSEDYVAEVKKSIIDNPSIKLFAPIVKVKKEKASIPLSPFKVKCKRGYPIVLISGKYSLYKYTPINSGMIINVKAFIETNGYNEKVKLDFADIQFIENFRKIFPDFVLINSIAFQNFSNDETDVFKLKKRFKLFCESAKNCDKKNLTTKFEYSFAVIIHMASLIYRTKNFSFLSVFINNYLK